MCWTAVSISCKVGHETHVAWTNQPSRQHGCHQYTRQTSRWSSNDDKRAARLVGYIAATVDFAQVMRIKDPPAKLWLSLYVDIDFGSSPDMKSTSGFILALEGPGRPKVNDGG